MRVLLDENLRHDLAALIEGHDADTVAGSGWSGTKNGELLQLASATHQAFITMDRRLPDGHQLQSFPFVVILLVAPSNRMTHLRPLVPKLLEALRTAAPGKLTVVAA